MKKAALVSTLLVLLLLCSCSAKQLLPSSFEPQKSFSVHMSADKNGVTFKADVTCASYEDIRLSFTSPEALNGFTVKASQGAYSIDAYGIDDCIGYNEINEQSFLNVLVNGLKTAVYTNEGPFKKNRAEGTYTSSFIVQDVPVSVVFDREGYPVRLTAPDIGLSVLFETYLTQEAYVAVG